MGSRSGRDAFLVFLGTLGAAATALAVAVIVAPERFGLDRGVSPSMESGRGTTDESETGHQLGHQLGRELGSGPSSPTSEVAATAQIGSDSEFDGGAVIERDPPDDPSSWGAGLVLNPSGIGYHSAAVAPSERPPASDFAFVARPSDTDLDPFAPRPVVDRAPSDPTLAQRIFEDARASVAHVTTLALRTERTIDIVSVAGTGSGLVWDSFGHIVTSRHVIENTEGANVTLIDGTRWKARLIGVDDATDIAVLQIAANPAQLVPIRVGTSGDLVVGMSVFSVACPYGLGHSLSTGSISGLNRSIQSTIARELHGTIQTDAPLHPGSSGGALIDDQGRVIGMNAAIHLDSGRAPGVGFALPIDRLQEIVPALLERGPRWYHEFGIMVASSAHSRVLLEDAEKQIQAARRPGGSPLPLPGRPILPESGLVVFEIDTSSGAADEGLRGMLRLVNTAGGEAFHIRDIIVGAGGQRVDSPVDIDRAIAALEPGEPLRLGLWRRGVEVPVIVQRNGAVAGAPAER